MKGEFPHKFSKTSNLFYIGNKPDLNYFPGMTEQEYLAIKSSNWSFQNELTSYLENDLYCLYHVLEKAN